MKESFAQIGVETTVKGMLFNSVLERARGNPQKAMNMWDVIWYPAFANGYDCLRTAFAKQSKDVWNLSYWYSDEFDALIKEGSTTPSPLTPTARRRPTTRPNR